jgi:hypothetical protein
MYEDHVAMVTAQGYRQKDKSQSRTPIHEQLLYL